IPSRHRIDGLARRHGQHGAPRRGQHGARVGFDSGGGLCVLCRFDGVCGAKGAGLRSQKVGGEARPGQRRRGPPRRRGLRHLGRRGVRRKPLLSELHVCEPARAVERRRRAAAPRRPPLRGVRDAERVAAAAPRRFSIRRRRGSGVQGLRRPDEGFQLAPRPQKRLPAKVRNGVIQQRHDGLDPRAGLPRRLCRGRRALRRFGRRGTKSSRASRLAILPWRPLAQDLRRRGAARARGFVQPLTRRAYARHPRHFARQDAPHGRAGRTPGRLLPRRQRHRRPPDDGPRLADEDFAPQRAAVHGLPRAQRRPRHGHRVRGGGHVRKGWGRLHGPEGAGGGARRRQRRVVSLAGAGERRLYDDRLGPCRRRPAERRITKGAPIRPESQTCLCKYAGVRLCKYASVRT
ncbi:hypothetical protein M885DRAFT_610329, partial [Pelagophyceae sp. CCMP2097]